MPAGRPLWRHGECWNILQHIADHKAGPVNSNDAMCFWLIARGTLQRNTRNTSSWMRFVYTFNSPYACYSSISFAPVNCLIDQSHNCVCRWWTHGKIIKAMWWETVIVMLAIETILTLLHCYIAWVWVGLLYMRILISITYSHHINHLIYSESSIFVPSPLSLTFIVLIWHY